MISCIVTYITFLIDEHTSFDWFKSMYLNIIFRKISRLAYNVTSNYQKASIWIVYLSPHLIIESYWTNSWITNELRYGRTTDAEGTNIPVHSRQRWSYTFMNEFDNHIVLLYLSTCGEVLGLVLHTEMPEPFSTGYHHGNCQINSQIVHIS